MLKLASRNLLSNKTRTLLATLGLIIGVVTIVTLISLTAGLRASFDEYLEGMTGVMVLEKGAYDVPFSHLSTDWEEKLGKFSGVTGVYPEIWGIVTQIEGGKAEGAAMAMGMVMALGLDAQKETTRSGFPYGMTLAKGRKFSTTEKYSVILGDAIADTYKKSVGSTIKIEGQKFRVVGVFTASEMGDMLMAMPIDAAREIADMPNDEVSIYTVQTYRREDEEKVAKKIEFKYEDELEPWTVGTMTEMMDDAFGIIDQAFGVIAGAALLIAGVGIINTMLMSVMERKKEFGVLRAMGWTQENVIGLVVTESVLMGAAGGAMGLLISYLIALAVSSVLGFMPVITFEIMGFAIGFSLFAGLFGGVYPAWKASKTDPIAAMRGE